MYRKILVPLDGSALARKAIAHAGRLASQLEAKCHLLWVQPLIGGFPSGVTFASAFPFQPPYVMPGAPDDQESVAREIEELIENAPPAGYTYSMERGSLVQHTLTYARNWSCDLIVMPNPQYVGLAKLLAGREAQHVTEQAECPVLLVVDDGTPDSLHRETLHREICQKIAPHHKLLAQAARCDEDSADRAFPEAVAMLLKGLATRRPSGSRLADIVNELRFHDGGIHDVAEFFDGGHSGADLGLVSHIMHEHATESAALLAGDVPGLTQTQALALLGFLSPIVLTELANRSRETSALRTLLLEEISKAETLSEKKGYEAADKVLA